MSCIGECVVLLTLLISHLLRTLTPFAWYGRLRLFLEYLQGWPSIFKEGIQMLAGGLCPLPKEIHLCLFNEKRYLFIEKRYIVSTIPSMDSKTQKHASQDSSRRFSACG